MLSRVLPCITLVALPLQVIIIGDDYSIAIGTLRFQTSVQSHTLAQKLHAEESVAIGVIPIHRS